MALKSLGLGAEQSINIQKKKKQKKPDKAIFTHAFDIQFLPDSTEDCA